MSLEQLLTNLNAQPEQVSFAQVQQVIQDHYAYTASSFNNNGLESRLDQNQGSCKIFAFAKLNKLSKQQTLHCFGDYYRVDVLQHPDNTDHGNIRQFMQSSATLEAITFEHEPLVPSSL